MQSVLLPGGLGYIGSITTAALYKYFQDKKYKIIIIDNLVNSSVAVKDRINKHLNTENAFEFYEISILDVPKLKQLFEDQIQKGTPIKYVIHFAALKAVGESVQKPLLYFENNVTGTINLLNVMQMYDCNNILFSSSATVYKAGEYVDEEVCFQPSNPYGETKVTVEYLLRSLSKNQKMRIISLRYFNPVGATSDGLLGESPQQFPNNLFPYIEQVAAGKRPELTVFGKDYPTPDGTGVRDYIHVVDLADGHIVALQRLIDKQEQNVPYYDYFNLGSGKGYSVLEIVQAYSKAMGKQLPYKMGERRAGDVAVLTANPEKAKKDLNWVTKSSLDDMCADSYKFSQINPNGIQ